MTPYRRILARDHDHRFPATTSALECHGEGWEGAREAVGGEGGWPLYLQRFAEVIGEQQ